MEPGSWSKAGEAQEEQGRPRRAPPCVGSVGPLAVSFGGGGSPELALPKVLVSYRVGRPQEGMGAGGEPGTIDPGLEPGLGRPRGTGRVVGWGGAGRQVGEARCPGPGPAPCGEQQSGNPAGCGVLAPKAGGNKRHQASSPAGRSGSRDSGARGGWSRKPTLWDRPGTPSLRVGLLWVSAPALLLAQIPGAQRPLLSLLETAGTLWGL